MGSLEKELSKGGHGTMDSQKRNYLKKAREPWVPRKGTP
jgi:hypothetical protein